MKKIRCSRLCSIALFSALLAACSGGGQPGATSMIPATSAAIATQTPTTMSVISASGTTLTVAGQVIALNATGFEIQGGQGLGFFNVTTNASTTYSGAKPYVGETVMATGTGSKATSITAATSVAQLPVVSGSVVALKTGGFEIQGGAHVGYLNVWTNSSTVFSGTKPYVGESVTVAGTGSLSTSLTAVTVAQNTSSTATPTPTPTTAPKPTATPVPQTTSVPVTSAFMPSSNGKISAFQVFDNTSNGSISQAAAAANGHRYTAVWGARNNIGTAWLTSNPSLQTAYYNALATDESPSAWGYIGHTLSWWQANHPDWVLYSCTSAGTPTTTPTWISGLANVPLDIHNPAVIDYQVRLMANYAHQMGYRALAIDEAAFWQAGKGAGYGCGIYQSGSFVRRYTGVEDPNYTADVIAWVKRAHYLLNSDSTLAAYHLKLIVNHPEDPLNTNEEQFLANVDADLNEDGVTWFGNYKKTNPAYVKKVVDWTIYAQKLGVAVLTDDNWGSNSVGSSQLDYSIAAYLMANEGAESIFASAENGFGLEQWHSQYTTAVGAPCGEYYSAGDSANPGIYYRRFANAIVVANFGSAANQVAHLPAGHTYQDLLGRPVANPLTIPSNDGYVLLTTNGCQ